MGWALGIALLCVLLLPGAASAETLSFSPVRQKGGVAVYRIQGVGAADIRAAYLVRGTRQRKLNLRQVRKGAQRGVLKVRTARKRQRRAGKRHRSRKRRRSRRQRARRSGRDPKLVVFTTTSGSSSTTTTTTTGGAAVSLSAAADGYVTVNKKTGTFGTGTKLRVSSGPETISYLRFDVSGLVYPVQRATLKLHTAGASSEGFDARGVASTSWTEKSLTYKTAPAAGPIVASSGAFASDQWVTLDVTSLVSGNGAVGFALTSGVARGITLDSREVAASPPQLTVETATPISPPPPLPPPPNEPPKATFTISPNPAYTGQTVSFDASGSSDLDGSIVNYKWDLDGDGTLETNTGSSPKTTKAFTYPNNRSLTLQVTDEDGATGVVTKTMYLSSPPSSNQSPSASFTISPNPAYTGQTVSFDASGSGDSDGSVVNYRWDLDGDGTLETDTGSNPRTTKVFTHASTRSIKLQVTDDGGATGVVTKTLSLSSPPTGNQSPSASFTISPNPATTGQSVSFNASASSDPDGSIANHKWDLDGNGTFETDTGTSASASRTYSSAASLTVRLRVTDNGGATADASKALTVNAPTATPPPTGATTYYVDSQAGSDSNAGTSESQAWRSLAKASAAALNPGDRLLLKRGGTWSGGLNLNRSGSASAPITVGAYGTGNRPLIQGDCLSLTGSYIVVKDLHLDNCSWEGIDVSGDENVVDQNVATNNIAGVFVRPGAVGNSILRNDLRDNNRMSVLTVGGDDDSGAFGILVQGDDTEIAYNTISGSDAFSYDYGRDGGAVEIYGGQRTFVHHNFSVGNDAFTELGNSRSADNTFAYNVVRSSLSGSRFLVTRGASNSFGPVARTRLYNNTVHLTGLLSEGFVCYGGCGTSILTMRNNVIHAVVKAGYADAPFDEDYNLYSGGVLQFVKGIHSLVGDPGFVDALAGNLRLRTTSPAIDRGTAVSYTRDADNRVAPQDGDGNGTAAYDIGAYELPGTGATNQAPSASFTVSPNPATTGQSVSFNGSASSDPDGSIANYKWDLDGNGTFETDTGASASASRTYSSAASLTVKLRVTDNAGTTADSSKSLSVEAPPSGTDPVITAAGDISCPGVCGQDDTAALIKSINPTAVLGLGDFQYDYGTLENFNKYYDPYWGPFKSKTYAINGGSHDFYGTGDYLTYFNNGGPRTLQPEGSYSFDLGAWHIVALDSYCFERSTCDENYWANWLKTDLAAHKNTCTMAYWHQPYWTSPSNHQPKTAMKPWIQALYDAGVDVVLQAHNHVYERFHPQNPANGRDDARGIRAFTAGTGGRSSYSFSGTAANSVSRNDNTFGVLKMTLHPTSYDWQFVPVAGKTFTDTGSASCH